MELDIANAKERSSDYVGNSGYRKYDDFGSARSMRPEEKRISFYNRYFIFRKNRIINAKQLKNSFLSYAGLQEEHARGGVGELDEESEKIALEKITRSSTPIDVATKPAIAAEIIKKKENEKLEQKLVEKPTTAKNRKLKITASAAASEASAVAAAAAADKEPGFSLAESNAEFSAPIEQIEKSLKKRSRKAKNDITGESGSAALEQIPAGIENPLQPPKTKIVRKITKKVSLVTTDQPATGASAAVEPEKKGEAAAPKKTRKKKETSDK